MPDTASPSNIERLKDELPEESLSRRLVESCADDDSSEGHTPKSVIQEQYRKHFDQIKNA
ncbi:hypothetical protein V7x_41020 [Crateriforma conspicua]|uniref:Uncharacterized protein n=1 Tax=Crateriforma conspicua TaxID=2527996 RepID=A0A5C6FPN2_9PLAN|nr:hypothetical protein [Crateriforma conspicua]TWU62373.1 hypothetical protein V7x_41020 [Crateriforma conspicua]